MRTTQQLRLQFRCLRPQLRDLSDSPFFSIRKLLNSLLQLVALALPSLLRPSVHGPHLFQRVLQSLYELGLQLSCGVGRLLFYYPRTGCDLS